MTTNKRDPIIRRNPDGSIDEIILYDLDYIHIEQMGGCHWWVGLAKDRSEEPIHVHFRSRAKIKCEDVWRPIESAPTDGTPVLVYVPGWERSNVLIGWWDDHPRCRCWIAGGYMHKYRPPTMWRPAPEPPTEHGMPC